MRHFQRYVSLSDVLDWAPGSSATRPKLELAPGARFVFGGDLFDKGPGDIRLARCLTDLKRQRPEDVALIVGNRDGNKTRLTSELDPRDAVRHPRDVPGPYWVPAGGRVSYHQYLRARLSELMKSIGCPVCDPEDDYAPDLYAGVSSPLSKLRYMLTHTMGCHHTFEHRRAELAFLQGSADPTSVTDDEVLASFVDSVESDDPERGFVRAYLEAAQLAAVWDDSDTLFVHGAVDGLSCGFLPSDDSGDGVGAGAGTYVHHDVDARQWAAALNEWYHRALLDWKARPTWNEARSDRGGRALMGYGHQAAMKGRTVMVRSYMDGRQHPAVHVLGMRPGNGSVGGVDVSIPTRGPAAGPGGGVSDDGSAGSAGGVGDDVAVAQYLLESGIRRVCVGHQPFGDSPTIQRHVHHSHGQIEVINADTSFSHVGWGEAAAASLGEGDDAALDVHPVDVHAHDTRGDAVAEVVIHRGAARVRGMLANRRAFDFVVGRHDFEIDAVDDAAEADAAVAGGEGAGVVVDPLIGMETPTGWWVKAVVNASAVELGLQSPDAHARSYARVRAADNGEATDSALVAFRDAAAHATSPGEATASLGSIADGVRDRWYLLSQGRGFEVRYRWLLQEALLVELATPAPSSSAALPST